jgi:hypothetical protein
LLVAAFIYIAVNYPALVWKRKMRQYCILIGCDCYVAIDTDVVYSTVTTSSEKTELKDASFLHTILYKEQRRVRRNHNLWQERKEQLRKRGVPTGVRSSLSVNASSVTFSKWHAGVSFWKWWRGGGEYNIIYNGCFSKWHPDPGVSFWFYIDVYSRAGRASEPNYYLKWHPQKCHFEKNEVEPLLRVGTRCSDLR